VQAKASLKAVQITWLTGEFGKETEFDGGQQYL
jgi:hypothetical protein